MNIYHVTPIKKGINNLIGYYKSVKSDLKTQIKGTWTQRFQNFEKQSVPL